MDRDRCTAFVREGGRQDRLIQPILSARENLMPRNSRALCDQVMTIDKGRIHREVGFLITGALVRVDRGLILHLQLEDYVSI